MTVGQRVWRLFWKAIAPLTPHRSALGRILRSRGCKKPMSEAQLAREVGRAQCIFEDFDPATAILCIGSSHVVQGIDPAAAADLRLWNAGFVNGDYRMDYYVYQALRSRWPRESGQTVLMSDNFWLPSHQAEYTENFIYSVILHVLIGMPYRSSLLIGPHERRVRRLTKVRQPTDCFRGYTALPPDPLATDLKQRVLGHIRRAHYDPSEMEWFLRLRAAVEADGRRLILFRHPLREDYREALAAGDGADVWTPGVEAKAGLRILDYSDMPFPADCWRDADHFNALGAIRFTAALKKDLATS